MEKKRGIKDCIQCSKPINLEKDNFVLVGTYNRISNADDESYFHFICWVDYFNECVTRKAKANLQKVQLKTMQLLNNPMIKGLLNQVQGSEQLFAMLETPLQKEHFELYHKQKIQKLKEKIQNDRKKRGTRKRKMLTV